MAAKQANICLIGLYLKLRTKLAKQAKYVKNGNYTHVLVFPFNSISQIISHKNAITFNIICANDGC